MARAHVLHPIGLALAIPLVLAGFADVSLPLGRDNPGVIASADGQERTVVLGQGAGPVEVRGAAVAAGLRKRRRKGIGHIEVIVYRSGPARLHLVAAYGTVTVEDLVNNSYASFGALRGHSMFLAAGGRTPTAPLDLRVAVGRIGADRARNAARGRRTLPAAICARYGRRSSPISMPARRSYAPTGARCAA